MKSLLWCYTSQTKTCPLLIPKLPGPAAHPSYVVMFHFCKRGNERRDGGDAELSLGRLRMISSKVVLTAVQQDAVVEANRLVGGNPG
jgi:hypothetical protein